MKMRIFAWLLALGIGVSALGGSAWAAEYEPEDVYVLNFSNQNIEGYEDYDNKRLYASDHYGGLKVDEDGDGIRESDWNWTCFSVLNLINTQKLSQPGPGAWASIPVYCADAVTDGVPGYQYRRVNLEDSGYFSAQVAGRLRAVFMNSFPYIRDMEQLEAAVNAWQDETGSALPPLVSLRESEAISATQAAIWALTNEAEVYAPYLGTGGYYRESEMVDTAIFRQEATEHTADNIRGLYEYLMSLEPAAARDTVVSDAAFGSVGAKIVKDGETYTATITAEVTAWLGEADRVTLLAASGDCVSEKITLQNGKNTYELTIKGLSSDKETIKLYLEGVQEAADVFLYIPLGGREKSQTMLGYDSSALPVYGEMTIDPTDRVLNIYKTTTEGTPLENIRFEIYQVASLSDYLTGELSIGQTPTQEEILRYTAQKPLATVVTDKDGIASWSFGAVDGVYLVKELPNPVIERPVDPFYVAVPGNDGEKTLFAVNVYPKNTVISEDIQIRKDVLEIGRDEASLDVGKIHSWIIGADIPIGLAGAQKYEITDKLDHRLNYMGNLKVSVAEKAASLGEDVLVLEPEGDYTLLVSKEEVSIDGQSLETDTVCVALTARGMAKAAAAAGEDLEIRICFDAIINGRGAVGEQIPNKAQIDYVNSVGTAYREESDVPKVCTGGLKIFKTDASDITKNLAGATFQLARLASEAEIEVGLSKTYLEDGRQTELVFLSFFDNLDLEGDQVNQVTTNEDGIAWICGVSHGTYYLVETAAPAGYNLLSEPVEVTVNENSHLDDDPETPETIEGTSVTVRNSAKFVLPATGGIGTTVFTIVGVSLISLALGMFAHPNRKKEG